MVSNTAEVILSGPKWFSEEVLIVIGSIIIGVNFILFISNQAITVYFAAILFALGNGLSLWGKHLTG